MMQADPDKMLCLRSTGRGHVPKQLCSNDQVQCDRSDAALPSRDAPKGRPYCLKPAACVAGRRGCCTLCQPHRGRTPAHVARDAQIVDARRGGLSLRRIAAAHAITHQRVLQILRNAGEA